MVIPEIASRFGCEVHVAFIRNGLLQAPTGEHGPRRTLAINSYDISRDQGIKEEDVEAAIAACKEWKATSSTEYDVNPGELAMLTEHRSKIKRTADAEEIAKLNVELHSKAPPVHYTL